MLPVEQALTLSWIVGRGGKAGLDFNGRENWGMFWFVPSATATSKKNLHGTFTFRLQCGHYLTLADKKRRGVRSFTARIERRHLATVF